MYLSKKVISLKNKTKSRSDLRFNWDIEKWLRYLFGQCQLGSIYEDIIGSKS